MVRTCQKEMHRCPVRRCERLAMKGMKEVEVGPTSIEKM